MKRQKKQKRRATPRQSLKMRYTHVVKLPLKRVPQTSASQKLPIISAAVSTCADAIEPPKVHLGGSAS